MTTTNTIHKHPEDLDEAIVHAELEGNFYQPHTVYDNIVQAILATLKTIAKASNGKPILSSYVHYSLFTIHYSL